MFKKNNRLSKNKDFDNVFKLGRGMFLGFLGLKVLKNSLKINRFGVLVGTKVSKKAVDRNKIKRRLREAFRKISDNIISGHDIVITVSPAILNKDYIDIKEALISGLKRLKLWANRNE